MNVRAATIASIAIGLAAMAAMSSGGDGEPEWRREWVRRGVPMTKTIAVVMDVSGSMSTSGQIKLAQREVMTIASLFPDDGRIKVYAFGDRVEAWRKDWTQLPDGEALDDLWRWASAWNGKSSWTLLGEAVEAAVADETPDMSVVLISDGSPSPESAAECLARIKKALAARKAGPPPIHVIGISHPWVRSERELLGAIAKEADGAMVIYSREADEVPVPIWPPMPPGPK